MGKLIISDKELKKIHQIQLDMAIEVKRICEQNNINYFLIAGSLLGAVRHEGFIPWDDDLDIGMLREEYDKFINHAKEDLQNQYFLQTWNSENKYPQPFAKIRKKNTKFVEFASANVSYHKGVYIDIFPYDNVPNNLFKKNISKIKLYILKRLILKKVGYNLNRNKSIGKKIIYKILNFLSKTSSVNFYKELMYKYMTNYNNENTSEVVNIGGSYGYEREIIQRKWAENLIYLDFEGEKFKCFKEYKKYLNNLYGDYMTPPPLNKRNNRHGIIKLQL